MVLFSVVSLVGLASCWNLFKTFQPVGLSYALLAVTFPSGKQEPVLLLDLSATVNIPELSDPPPPYFTVHYSVLNNDDTL